MGSALLKEYMQNRKEFMDINKDGKRKTMSITYTNPSFIRIQRGPDSIVSLKSSQEKRESLYGRFSNETFKSCQEKDESSGSRRKMVEQMSELIKNSMINIENSIEQSNRKIQELQVELETIEKDLLKNKEKKVSTIDVLKEIFPKTKKLYHRLKFNQNNMRRKAEEEKLKKNQCSCQALKNTKKGTGERISDNIEPIYIENKNVLLKHKNKNKKKNNRISDEIEHIFRENQNRLLEHKNKDNRLNKRISDEFEHIYMENKNRLFKDKDKMIDKRLSEETEHISTENENELLKPKNQKNDINKFMKKIKENKSDLTAITKLNEAINKELKKCYKSQKEFINALQNIEEELLRLKEKENKLEKEIRANMDFNENQKDKHIKNKNYASEIRNLEIYDENLNISENAIKTKNERK